MSRVPLKSSRKAKSNRAQADYFELLTCSYICHLYNIRFSYSKDLALLSNKVLKLPDGLERMRLQNSNFLKLEPKLKKILKFETKRKGRIIEVLWIGRRLAIKTTSDVDAEHITKKLTRFSIKSIKGGGTGTVKNLGMRSLKKYLKIDFSQENKMMWEKLREHIQEFEISKAELKKKVNRRKRLLKWAKENGRDYQIKLNELCYKSFNNLSRKVGQIRLTGKYGSQTMSGGFLVPKCNFCREMFSNQFIGDIGDFKTTKVTSKEQFANIKKRFRGIKMIKEGSIKIEDQTPEAKTELAAINQVVNAYKPQITKLFTVESLMMDMYGTIEFSIIIGNDGSVEAVDSSVTSGSYFTDSFLGKARDIIKKWKFKVKSAVGYSFRMKFLKQ